MYILLHVYLCREKVEAALSCCSTIKKVTFYLNVKTLEEELAIEQVIIDNLVKNNENEGSVDLVKSNENDKETDNLKQENEKKESGDDDMVKRNEKIGSENIPTVPNYRYQNCATSEDDSDEDLELGAREINDGNGDCDDLGSDEQMLFVQEESSESLFSLSIESRKRVCEVELGEKEVNSPMPKCSANQQLDEARDGSQYVHSVLNPADNLTQWKVVKARAEPMPLKYHDKENINFCPEPSCKLTTQSSKLNSNKKKEVVDGGVAVDTSLSSWLVESEATPTMSKTRTVSDGNSSQSHDEDKPILGELTVEEVKELSVPTSARQSRRRCGPDEPKVGTIGSYWSHTGKILDSDSGSSSQGMLKTRSKNCEVRLGPFVL